MQVILLERVAKLGQMGEVVDVKPGYARNFLLPQGKALSASEQNIADFETRKAQTSAGIMETNIYRAVWLTIDGRRCSVDVAEVPNDCPALVGYVPLELLDFVVDPPRQKLIPDPKDGGQQVLDLF